MNCERCGKPHGKGRNAVYCDECVIARKKENRNARYASSSSKSGEYVSLAHRWTVIATATDDNEYLRGRMLTLDEFAQLEPERGLVVRRGRDYRRWSGSHWAAVAPLDAVNCEPCTATVYIRGTGWHETAVSDWRGGAA